MCCRACGEAGVWPPSGGMAGVPVRRSSSLGSGVSERKKC